MIALPPNETCRCRLAYVSEAQSRPDGDRCQCGGVIDYNRGGCVTWIDGFSTERAHEAAKALAEFVKAEQIAETFLRRLRRAEAVEERRWSTRPPAMSVAMVQDRHNGPSMRKGKR
jgi:hypothetical protein